MSYKLIGVDTLLSAYEGLMISDLLLLARSKKEARLEGEEFYFNGVCEQGHLAVRELSTGRCIVCKSDRSKKYYSENKEKIKKRAVELMKTKYSKDPKFKAAKIARTHLQRVISYAKLSKNKGTFDILGYTAEEFRLNMESKFKDGMSWENYGSDWHVDHIKAVALFDLIDLKDVALVNSLDNLEPVFVNDHKIKTIQDIIKIRKKKIMDKELELTAA